MRTDKRTEELLRQKSEPADRIRVIYLLRFRRATVSRGTRTTRDTVLSNSYNQFGLGRVEDTLGFDKSLDQTIFSLKRGYFILEELISIL